MCYTYYIVYYIGTHWRIKNMTLITRIEHKLRSRSKDRPKSLHILIPATIRDTMDFKVGDQIIMDVLDEQGSRILKIYKKPEDT
jgi:hypothetical protein